MVPILFVHYGPTQYLHRSLKAARHMNPNARIVLLGDGANRGIAARHGIEHVMFARYDGGRIVSEYAKAFRLIGGHKWPGHRHARMQDFIFRKWFFLYHMCREQKIDRFWYFDTDVIILDRLEKYVEMFTDCDYTTVCHGANIKGLVNDMGVLGRFCESITWSLRDPEVYARNMRDFVKHPKWGFDEMRASVEFGRRAGTRFIRIDEPVNGVFFDTALACDDGFETVGRFKRIYWRGRVPFCRFLKSGELVRMVVANCSWHVSELMPGLLRNAGVQ